MDQNYLARSRRRISRVWAVTVTIIATPILGFGVPLETAYAHPEMATAQAATMNAGCTNASCPLGSEWLAAMNTGGSGGYCWWQAECGHNCTNYVGWRMSRAGIPNFVKPSISAHGWDDRARSAGIPVNNTPSVGAIAYWESGAGRGSAGHVAIVEAINGGTLTISQDSYPSGPYSWQNITPGSGGAQTPSGYIHVPGFSAGLGGALQLVLAPGDWDGDGLADILHIQPSAMYLYRGNGTGGFLNGQGIAVGTSWHLFKKVLTPGDWDGDGNVDLLAIDNGGTLWLYRGNGSGAFAQSGGIVIGSSWHLFKDVVAPGDFNGDGHADLLAVAVNGDLYLYPGNGSGNFLAPSIIGIGWQGFAKLVTPGDWNGDGSADVLGIMPNGDMYRYTGNGAGGWATTSVLIGSSWTFREVVGTPDFSGNGTTDLLAVTNSGALYLYNGNGTGNFAGSSLISSGW